VATPKSSSTLGTTEMIPIRCQHLSPLIVLLRIASSKTADQIYLLPLSTYPPLINNAMPIFTITLYLSSFFVASHLKSANPFSKIKIQKLQTSLQNKAKEDNVVLYDKTAFFARKKNIVCPAFHKAGLVVPFNKKTTVGYRQMETEGIFLIFSNYKTN
jgi:Uncharacterised conserved protein (DUF2228)